eukprot:m.38942 g.38942  ORF g.38942 m.38942 type:complete len:1079 (-) comp5918_c0_seq1:1687-4923(-)
MQRPPLAVPHQRGPGAAGPRAGGMSIRSTPPAACSAALVLAALVCALVAPLGLAQEVPAPNVLRIGVIVARSDLTGTRIQGFHLSLALRTARDFLDSDDLKVELVFRDASPSELVSSVERCRQVAQFFVQNNIHAVIGPAVSSCAVETASILSNAGIASVSHSATSTVLSDKNTYRHFFRVVPSDAFQSVALANLIRLCNNWKNVGIIYADNVYGRALGLLLNEELLRDGITVTASISFTPESSLDVVRTFVQQLKEAGSAVNVVIAARTDVMNVLRAATQLEMTGDGWSWLASDGFNVAPDPLIADALTGTIAVNVGTGSGPLFDQFHSYEGNLDFATYIRNTGFTSFASRPFDALLSLRTAARNVTNWDSTADVRSGIIAGLNFLTKENCFEGATSACVFFDENHDGPVLYDVVNLVGTDLLRVGTIYERSGEQNLTIELSQPLTYAGGLATCPSDEQPDGIIAAQDSDSTSTLELALGVAVAVLLCALLGLLCYFRRRNASKPFDFGPLLSGLNLRNKEEDELITPREIQRRNVTILGNLGRGFFGNVMKAQLNEYNEKGIPSYTVAVKSAIGDTSGVGETMLLQEAALMAQFGTNHPNVVSLIGVVTAGGPLYLILQYCEFGSLGEYLRTRFRAHHELSLGSKLQMALDVANGMRFIASQGGVHRDLAARNVLVASDYACKVADFGMAKTGVYYQDSSRMVPIKWTAPEALLRGRYSEASDVWAFAILLVELVTDGDDPYPNMSNVAVRQSILLHNYRRPCMPRCPVALYHIMQKCWRREPENRLTFEEIHAELLVLRQATEAATEQMISQLDYDSSALQPLRRIDSGDAYRELRQRRRTAEALALANLHSTGPYDVIMEEPTAPDSPNAYDIEQGRAQSSTSDSTLSSASGIEQDTNSLYQRVAIPVVVDDADDDRHSGVVMEPLSVENPYLLTEVIATSGGSCETFVSAEMYAGDEELERRFLAEQLRRSPDRLAQQPRRSPDRLSQPHHYEALGSLASARPAGAAPAGELASDEIPMAAAAAAAARPAAAVARPAAAAAPTLDFDDLDAASPDQLLPQPAGHQPTSRVSAV